jgi:sigma-B regulation protein RsbU (phosphoserine phosphatase)
VLRRLLHQTKTSLRLRLLVTTLVLLALALALAVFAFERVARSVVSEAVHNHLAARAKEIQDSLLRFQRERALTVHEWASARAMQDTFDLGDPKFAEDHLRRSIQDQGGAITAAALLSVDERIITLVRDRTEGAWGFAVDSLRGATLDVARLRGKAAEDAVSVTLAPLSAVDRSEPDALTVVMTSPVRDFFGDLNGWIVVAISPEAIPRLLQEVNGVGGSYVPVVTDATRELVLSLPKADLEAAREVVLAPAQGVLGSLERIERVERGRAAAVLVVRTPGAQVPPGWSTLMMVDEHEASGRIDHLRLVLAVLFGAVLLVAGLVAVASLRQAAKPLGEVAASMVRVAGGDLSTRVKEAYTGELGALATSFNRMVEEVERSRDELQRTEALRREVEIAHQIQTAILPVSPAVKGFEVAARMQPADDVGGDLYDILAFGDTFWVLVGDVSGHGINSGLVMMMAQAAAYAAIADDPHCAPGAVIAAVNRVVHENVRRRMRRDDYMTLMAARHVGDGRFVAAGAHQPIFVAREGGRVDVVESQGPWVGLRPAVEPPPIEEYEFRLGPGDLVCFVTDGILEAHDGGGVLFGEERVKDLLAAPELPSASQALATLFDTVQRHSPEPADDQTAVVLRRKHEIC